MQATHAHHAALISQATPWAAAAYKLSSSPSMTSSRVVFPITFSKPIRLRCVRAASAMVDKPNAGEMTFYDLLGVPEGGTLPEIKQAYKRLADKYHPDVTPPGRVEEHARMLIRVKEAYETLSDPMRRAVYNLSKPVMSRFTEKMEYKRELRSRKSELSKLKRKQDVLYDDLGF